MNGRLLHPGAIPLRSCRVAADAGVRIVGALPRLIR
jgi:hypothetical protein